MSQDAVANAFLRRYVADREKGSPLGLAAYQVLWPAHAELIERLHQRLTAGEGIPGPFDAGDAVPEDGIGPYVVLRELGRGGQGVLFLADDPRLERQVAIKVLTGWGAFSPVALRRFEREAHALAKVHHPGLCPILDAGSDRGVPYLVMPFVEGSTLASILSAAGAGYPVNDGSTDPESDTRRAGRPEATAPTGRDPRSAADVPGLVEKAARALHAAHEAGIVHRDVKPGNIMVTPTGEPVVLDFGLASFQDPGVSTLTGTGELFGTPAYMSPEQIAGDSHQIDRRTDVWSLGVILYEGLTGFRPFQAPTREALYHRIQGAEPEDPRRLNAGVSRDLAAIIAMALEKEPGRRYQTALDLAEDLRRVRGQEPVTARRIGGIQRAARWARRHPARAGLLGVSVLAFAALTGFAGYFISTWPGIVAQREREQAAAIERLVTQGFVGLAENDEVHAQDAFREVLRRRPGHPEAIVGEIFVLVAGSRRDLARQRLEEPDTKLLDAETRICLGAMLDRNKPPGTPGKIESVAAPLGSLALAVVAYDHLGFSEQGSTPKLLSNVRELLQWAIAAQGESRLFHHLLLASTVSRMNDRHACRRMARILLTRWPEWASAWQSAAKCLRKFEPAEALAHARRAREMDPGDHRILATLGLILTDQDHLDEAIEVLREAARRAPNWEVPWRYLSNTLIKAGRNEDAIDAARKAIEAAPRASLPRSRLADVLLNLGRLDDAVLAIEEAVSLGPHDPSVFAVQASILDRLGRPREAEVAFRRAVELNPYEPMFHYRMGNFLKRQHDLPGARTAFERAVSLPPGHPDHHCNLANTLRELKDYDAALSHYRRALALDPRHAKALSGLGRLHLERREPEPALGCFLRSLERDPNSAEIQCNAGHCLKALGRFREALEHFRRGDVLGRSRSDWSHASEKWVAECGLMAAVEERLEATLAGAEVPTDAESLRAFQQILRLQRRHGEAARLWRRVFEASPALAEDQTLGLEAASAAALAGTGDGREDLDESTKAELRAWTLSILRGLLARLQEGSESRATRQLEHWIVREDLAPMRDADRLAALPAAEAEAWRGFWSEVDDALLRAR